MGTPWLARLEKDISTRAVSLSGNLDDSARRIAAARPGAVIVAGIDLGEYCMVGAGAVASRSVPPRALVVGSPAKRIGWVCDCGQRLPSDGASLRCDACARSYALDAAGGLSRA